MARVHDFGESLARSNSARDEAFWEACYRQAFPDFKAMIDNARDNGAQRCGVDRLIVLKSSHVIRVDEKAREKDYGDLLLEVVSNDRTGAPGWIEKDLTIDYLAYGVLESRRAYLFPWPLLRAAWVRNGEGWKVRAKAGERGYRVTKAPNRTYNTWSVCVPMDVVVEAVRGAMVVQVPGEAA
jgi:hypothetical protein